ncbi:hypothetical protein [Caulobacter sp. DWP3-1-3b2]
MKLLLIAAVAVLSLLVAAGDNVGPPLRYGDAVWSATMPIHSPK